MKNKMLYSIGGAVLYVFSLISMAAVFKPEVKEVIKYESPTIAVPGTISPKFPLPGKDTAGVWEVLGTYYNPVARQCDATPFITADGSKINKSKLKKEQIKWVALSRDLLARWGGPFDYGDTLYVHHTNEHVRGIWIVHDSMNARFRKRMDFLRWTKGRFPGKAKNVLISTKPFYNKR
jgi:hypothetical protein